MNDPELAAFGESLSTMLQRAVQAYAREFPDAAAGLVLAVQDGTTRLQLVATVGGDERSEIAVLAITGRDVLSLVRMRIEAAV
jgi:hypothetical protein